MIDPSLPWAVGSPPEAVLDSEGLEEKKALALNSPRPQASMGCHRSSVLGRSVCQRLCGVG